MKPSMKLTQRIVETNRSRKRGKEHLYRTKKRENQMAKLVLKDGDPWNLESLPTCLG